MQNVIHILNKRSPFTRLEKDVVLLAGERRHAERKRGYGGQKFPKLAKPAKVTKKVTPTYDMYCM